MSINDGALLRIAALSAALVPIFGGRFCNVLLPTHEATSFEEKEAIYEIGDEERTFFFIWRGVVKTGTITDGGLEIMHDVRKYGMSWGNSAPWIPCVGIAPLR